MTRMKMTVAALALLLPGAVQAQSQEIGAELYGQYCATCHGAGGAGDGPLTEVMTETPADLRGLAATNEMAPGEFPMLKVIHIIDGRTGLRGHGGAMPTYGRVFMAETEPTMELTGAVLETRGRVLSLALYLESIQE